MDLLSQPSTLELEARLGRLRFHVPGSVKGWKRAGVRIVQPKNGKRFVSHYTPSQTRHFEGKVSDYAMQAKGKQKWDMTERPVKMSIEAVFQVPASWSNKKRAAAMGQPYAGKPDSDNIFKAVSDALNGIVYVDDKQVWALQVIKRYAKPDEGEGMYVTVSL